MIDVIMRGFNRIPNASEFDISITKTPFGSTEELRNNVKSIIQEVVEMERLPVVTFSAGGCYTGRCSIDDESWYGWSFRWFWDLQEF